GIRDDLVTGVQTCALPISAELWIVGRGALSGGLERLAGRDLHVRVPGALPEDDLDEVPRLLVGLVGRGGRGGRAAAVAPAAPLEIGRASCRERVCSTLGQL